MELCYYYLLRVTEYLDFNIYHAMGGDGRVVRGVVYLTSPGRPTDIGLQLGKDCYPCSR